ncbi:MAG TPA: glycosyltransferase family 39 protein [Solirubrobacteraceae bacterium]|nr:glycosyltransferase family 39 protein [Solirubrobacteraceae bacterium]
MGTSWDTRSLASAPASAAPVSSLSGTEKGFFAGAAAVLARRVRRPELLLLCGLAAGLNLWALSRNGWANDYYSAAVRSMSSSWHDFLYASLDRSGVMTVDKPPLALWVQALSVRVFGYHSMSVLVPQALMGVASVALVYDLVRRFFGRFGGFIAGLALATTPIMVAVSRHNNPDALLVLCSVAALWCTVRAFETAPRGRGLRWLVLAGVCVGLGFETKMGVALTVVPGIALAWLWVAPAARGRLHALRQLLAGGAAMVIAGGAWPALVALTPASQRPWISGTSDNSIFSLILEYNGVGRVDGQTGGPGGVGGGGGNMFGGSAGPLRLLNSALGGQAGWLLGLALAGGVAILLSTRLRRSDGRTGWLLAVGGAFATTAVLFSAASGIFHPYYVSLLAPSAAALAGAGAAQIARSRSRVLGVLAIAAGVTVELVVRSRYPGQLTWLPPLLIGLATVGALGLLIARGARMRSAALAVAVGALLLAPAAWAFDTLGYATSGTFPAGGPQSAQSGGPGGGAGARPAFGGGGVPQLFGSSSTRSRGGGEGPPQGGRGAGGFAPPGAGAAQGAGGAAGQGRGGAIGAPFGQGASLTGVLSYTRAHGGGTIAVSSQSSAASSIILNGAEVAGIGGFSGRESDPSTAWLAQEVRSGAIRWVLVEASSGQGGFGRSDTRKGAKSAMAAAAKACTRVTLSSSSAGTLYDCQGRAAAIASAT